MGYYKLGQCVLEHTKHTELVQSVTINEAPRLRMTRTVCHNEAYAIYMSVRKLAYYLEDANITLRSDHLPLKRFLAKNTLNSKVNNWAVEISPFRNNL